MGEIIFCKECNNVLQPKEDKPSRMLMLICRTCRNVTYANASDPVTNTVEVLNFNHRSAEDITSYILPGLQNDSTLPREKDWHCKKCGQLGAVYFQLPERVAGDALTLVYVCVHCTYYEIKGKETEKDS